MLRLLTIGHSYVVAQNRRLAHEMALAGKGQWQVTAVAPRTFRGDLRAVVLESMPGEACELVPLDLRFASSPHLFFYRGLGNVMKRTWDVVHCWEEPYVTAGAQVAGLLRNGSALVPATFQNLAKNYPPPFKQLERYVMTRARGWIAFGESVRAVHRHRRLYAARPERVIPPGVDLHSFRPDPKARSATRERLGWSGDDLVIGFLGRFVTEKGIHLLLRVLPRLSSPWRALFVGGGPLHRELERFASMNRGRVHILTGVEHDEVPAHLNAMDVLCAPSRTTARWKEQFGRMLIEAMACGVPVIASCSAEIPHVVGDAGIVVAEEDDQAWTSAIDELLANARRRDEFARRGLARARERYAWPVVASAHLDFFQELLAQ